MLEQSGKRSFEGSRQKTQAEGLPGPRVIKVKLDGRLIRRAKKK